jgi:hypothetical protein
MARFRRREKLKRELTFLAGLVVSFHSASAQAVDPFEIQVYDGTSNAPGTPGLELHVNHVATGVKEGDFPVLPPNHQTHFTFEPSLGVTKSWELGAYFQLALRADGQIDFAGSKLRSKFVTPPRWDPHWRLGANFELASIPTNYDRDHWGIEVRPIAAWANDTWLFAVNPIIEASIAGPGLKEGPAFAPAGMIVYDIAHLIGLGLEYYADLGPFAGFEPLSRQQHYVYEVFHLLAVDDFELQMGVGEGLTTASNPLTYKMIVGYVFDPRSEAERQANRRMPRSIGRR